MDTGTILLIIGDILLFLIFVILFVGRIRTP